MPKLTDHQKDQLLQTLKHYLPMDLRGKIMRELPQAYNAWMGYEIVRVHRVSDGLPIDSNEERVTEFRFDAKA